MRYTKRRFLQPVKQSCNKIGLTPVKKNTDFYFRVATYVTNCISSSRLFCYFASSASVEAESDDKTTTVDEADVAVPESPIPDLPPRAPGVVVSARVPSVTEKKFLNEKTWKVPKNILSKIPNQLYRAKPFFSGGERTKMRQRVIAKVQKQTFQHNRAQLRACVQASWM